MKNMLIICKSMVFCKKFSIYIYIVYIQKKGLYILRYNWYMGLRGYTRYTLILLYINYIYIFLYNVHFHIYNTYFHNKNGKYSKKFQYIIYIYVYHQYSTKRRGVVWCCGGINVNAYSGIYIPKHSIHIYTTIYNIS